MLTLVLISNRFPRLGAPIPPLDGFLHDTAMEEEMHALTENETWDLVDAPKGVKPIECRSVYKVKYNTDGLVN